MREYDETKEDILTEIYFLNQSLLNKNSSKTQEHREKINILIDEAIKSMKVPVKEYE